MPYIRISRTRLPWRAGTREASPRRDGQGVRYNPLNGGSMGKRVELGNRITRPEERLERG